MAEQLIPNGSYLIYSASANSGLRANVPVVTSERQSEKFIVVARNENGTIPRKQKIQTKAILEDRVYLYTFKTLEQGTKTWASNPESVRPGTQVVANDTGTKYLVEGSLPHDQFVILTKDKAYAWTAKEDKIVLERRDTSAAQNWAFEVVLKADDAEVA